MSFHSVEFWVFFAAVFSLYSRLRRRGQNLLLLAASYVFYFSFARGFVLLLAFTTYFDFFCGKTIAAAGSRARKRLFLALSLLSNLTVLVLFKYFGFFALRFGALFGSGASDVFLGLAVPIGISFYILQSMSYVIDVYRGACRPHDRFLEYALYISFFPQLLAGPIERATQMLPQIASDRKITAKGIGTGLWLCFWGLVEKCVVSDNLQAQLITPYFQHGGSGNGLAAILVLWACCVRIYCDFDGYSNIARGLGKMMGFELTANFFLPLYAVSSQDLWRRFHITFYKWMRDYVYFPLVKGLRIPFFLALPVVFALSGLWHQVSWTFVCWGLYEAAVILVTGIPGRFIAPVYESSRGPARWLLAGSGMLLTKFFRSLGTAFFVAETVPAALARIRPALDFSTWSFGGDFPGVLFTYLFFIFPLFLVEALQLRRNHLLAPLELPPAARAGLVAALFLFLFVFGVIDAQKFVYFQF